MTKKIHKGDLDKLKEFAPRIFKDEALEVVMQAIQNVEEEQNPQWPSEGDEYWLVEVDGDTTSLDWDDSSCDKDWKAQGNIFRTKEEAEAEAERRAIMQELRECEGVVEFNRMEKVWQINCNLNGIAFYPDWSNVTKRLGDVYFDSKGSAKAAIRKLGDTKLRKLFRVEG